MGKKRHTVESIVAMLREAEVQMAKGQTLAEVVRLRPEHKDQVWSYDFVSERTSDGRPLRMLNIIDEYTRECLAIRVRRTIKANDVIGSIHHPRDTAVHPF